MAVVFFHGYNRASISITLLSN